MAIQPVKLALPTPPPTSSSRPSTEAPRTPVAPTQAGASPVAGTENVVAPQTGTPAALLVHEVVEKQASEAREAPDRKKLLEAIENAQKAINGGVRDFSFSIHEKTGEIVVRIIDRESKEVIRQIPAEEMLRIAENLQTLEGENRPGLLLKQEA